MRVLVADDHEMIRQGLRAVIESHPGWTVCGEAADGNDALDKADHLRPDAIVMDVSMPLLNGLEATRRLRRTHPDIPVLILSMHESEQLIQEVLAAGARGYVLKSDAGRTIFDALDALRRGSTYFTSRVSDILLKTYLDPQHAAAADTDPLTSREREIVQLIAEGKSTKEVAATLDISVKTADTHRTNLMRKLGIHSVSELVRYAIRNGIVAP